MLLCVLHGVPKPLTVTDNMECIVLTAYTHNFPYYKRHLPAIGPPGVYVSLDTSMTKGDGDV